MTTIEVLYYEAKKSHKDCNKEKCQVCDAIKEAEDKIELARDWGSTIILYVP